ncbi:hypothetical protein [Aquimarina sp. MMG016]|uniref:hypothetical protein n=1 Tax=Aquimarina sp. MMG016 TaxID=2822690 RepID=UPI001B3A61D7|nr:hypothetical protein [Aquimarina sp. MMG016]MBQ4819083.1 hypothetical protein [Aquimarina sp. MMG016]
MLKKVFKFILKLLLFIFLTILTQIGGIVYIAVELLVKKHIKRYRAKKAGIFLIAYLTLTFLVVPYIAPIFGREKIDDTNLVEAHTFFTKLMNRNYISSELQESLKEIALDFHKQNPRIKIIYLDANFPFINGFPLPPHLSHSDGKKIDISLIYKNQEGNITNKKPSLSGYGVYEAPIKGEYNQIKACKQKGYWQYDFAKYITFGKINKDIKLSEKATKDLLLAIVKQQQIGKVFIEPHLKNRLGLKNSKIRFHGCQAVRHDDHIHLQLK